MSYRLPINNVDTKSNWLCIAGSDTSIWRILSWKCILLEWRRDYLLFSSCHHWPRGINLTCVATLELKQDRITIYLTTWNLIIPNKLTGDISNCSIIFEATFPKIHHRHLEWRNKNSPTVKIVCQFHAFLSRYGWNPCGSKRHRLGYVSIQLHRNSSDPSWRLVGSSTNGFSRSFVLNGKVYFTALSIHGVVRSSI